MYLMGEENNKKGIIGKLFAFIAFVIKAIWSLLGALGKTLNLFLRILSFGVLILSLFVFYNLYVDFSDLKNRGLDVEDAALKALDMNMLKVKDQFDAYYRKYGSYLSNIPSWFNFSFDVDYGDYSLREEYLSVRGVPEVFVVMMSYDQLKEGEVIKREKPLRFESWMYGGDYRKKVVFENGFLKEEKSIKSIGELAKHSLSPLFFHQNTTIGEVRKILGSESCAVTDKGGVVTYRFSETDKRPITSVSFVNNKFISATVGIVFLGEQESLCN